VTCLFDAEVHCAWVWCTGSAVQHGTVANEYLSAFHMSQSFLGVGITPNDVWTARSVVSQAFRDGQYTEIKNTALQHHK